MVTLLSLRMTVVLWLAASLAAISVPGYAQVYHSQRASFSFVSDTGDPIGEGESVNLTEVWAVSSEDSRHREVAVFAYDGTGFRYGLLLQAPEGETIQLGRYEGAVLYNTDAKRPGISLRSSNWPYGCESLSGSFTVHQIRRGYGDYLERFRATFEQQCEGAPGALVGEVVIANARDRPPQVDMDIELAWIEDDQLWLRVAYTCENPSAFMFAGFSIAQRQGRDVVTAATPLGMRLEFCSDVYLSKRDVGVPVGKFREGLLHVTANYEIDNRYIYSDNQQVVRATDDVPQPLPPD